MTPATIEERVREFVAAERAQTSVPPLMAIRILHVMDQQQPPRSRRPAGFLRLAAAMAAVLVLAAGIGLMRTSTSPARAPVGAWTSAPSMAVPRAFHTATLLSNGKVLVVGGSGEVASTNGASRLVTVASAELYDPKTRSWSSAGTLRTARWLHTATLLQNGEVLVVGGTSSPPIVPDRFESLSSAELYDPLTNRWSPAADMLTARCLHSATLLADGRVLVAGGYQTLSEMSGRVLASAEVYDPRSNSWSSAGSMAAPTAEQSAVLLADNRVLVAGGAVGDLNSLRLPVPQRTAEIYDPATGSWSSTQSMHLARIRPSSSLLPDGRVLVVGDAGLNEQSAEVFDPRSGLWSATGKPAAGHSEAVAAQLRNGNVLVAGGTGETTAEVFDWQRNSWSGAGLLAVIRADAAATVFPGGQVLIVGGFGTRSAPWASAEVYDPAARPVSRLAPRSSAPAGLGQVGLWLAILVVLLALLLGILRRRRAVGLRPVDGWIDP
jgi:galactose oxidase-like protein